MLLYYETPKENVESFKINGFSSEHMIKNKGSIFHKVIFFYKNAHTNYSNNLKLIKVNINKINILNLDKNYDLTNEEHIKEIRRIIFYLKLNSDKNCLLNLNKNEYIFFKYFKYDIIE